MSEIAVVLPCRNARHLLWRSLASLAAQTWPPDQILVLDHGSSDGIRPWLCANWPGVEVSTVAFEADASAIRQVIGGAVAAPRVAVLAPGERWQPDHLEALATDPAGLIARERLLAKPERVLTAPTAARPPTAAAELAEAIAGLPGGDEAILVDLAAAAEPLGLVDLLGMGAALGPSRPHLHAWTAADLHWPTIEGLPAAIPVLVGLGGCLDAAHATAQLCLEEVLHRLPDRPIRLLPAGIDPGSLLQVARLLDAVARHRDAEIWVQDEVSRRWLRALLPAARARLVPPPCLALAPMLRELTERALVQPELLAGSPGAEGLAARLGDHARLWAGLDDDAVRRVALGLARIVGIGRWLKPPLLQQAWRTVLAGWAVARLEAEELTCDRPEIAVFAAMCGRRPLLRPKAAKARDLAATWADALRDLGVRIGA